MNMSIDQNIFDLLTFFSHVYNRSKIILLTYCSLIKKTALPVANLKDFNRQCTSRVNLSVYTKIFNKDQFLNV